MRDDATPSLLRVGVVGAGRRGRAYAAAVARLPGARLVGVADAVPERADACVQALGSTAFASTPALIAEADAVVVAVPTRDRFLVARTAVAEGRHVFLAWPPTTSLDEAERLAHRAEEAGVEVGVARPLPVGPLLAARPAGWRPRLIALHLAAGPASDAAADPDDLGALPWSHRLAGAADLCLALAGSRDLQRAEAEADRGPGLQLRTVAFSLRFRNGTYAQAVLREDARRPAADERFRLDASGQGLRVSARTMEGPLCIEAQNPGSDAAFEPARNPAADDDLARFIEALGQRRPAPVSVLDALHTLRLVERLMARLR